MKTKAKKAAEINEIAPLKVCIHDLDAYQICLSVYDALFTNRGKKNRNSGITVKMYKVGVDGVSLNKGAVNLEQLLDLLVDLENADRLTVLNLMIAAELDIKPMISEYTKDVPRGDKVGDAIEPLNVALMECVESYTEMLEEIRNPSTKKKTPRGATKRPTVDL